ncbi:hypothetical protein EJB05_47302, partial [Eragrostis curvula]
MTLIPNLVLNRITEDPLRCLQVVPIYTKVLLNLESTKGVQRELSKAESLASYQAEVLLYPPACMVLLNLESKEGVPRQLSKAKSLTVRLRSSGCVF